MPKNIRVLFGVLTSAAQCGNYVEASRTMMEIAKYSEFLQNGQPCDVVERSKEYIKNMRECAENVVMKPEWAIYQFKDVCTEYANEVLIPWLNDYSEECQYECSTRKRHYSS